MTETSAVPVRREMLACLTVEAPQHAGRPMRLWEIADQICSEVDFTDHGSEVIGATNP